MKIDHIAIAVDDLKEAVQTYSTLLQVDDIEYERVESEGVSVAILHLENGRIELMEPIGDSSPIKKFLEKKGPGLHHIALETEGIDSQVSRMTSCGIRFLGEVRPGSAGTRVTFIHPKSLHGVLAELCAHPK
ncbi:MAG: methylmalonyl-CoA epimerase [Cenarchaeum sp. SB0663_bin_5]|nr:methylmalonyl-CoA epimerase [Cenarchaeum sp. SB0663_bin_5]MYH04106.1 methylmalonyl-CoA epimerase [Cenarchaeum sp. SB0675_bin_21]MYL10578.1 methylmalonyl-CoA epimerase [Cenarchaeum sp. SB0669_bin_11]